MNWFHDFSGLWYLCYNQGMTKIQHLLLILFVMLSLTACASKDKTIDPTVRFAGTPRVIFLGDSITHSGAYVSYIEAYLRTRFPEHAPQIFNLGLGSETLAGTSEKDHPWPRPNVHERLGRVLQKTAPNTIVACYGMNDGIYAPLSQPVFGKFRAGVYQFQHRATTMGANVLWLTPGWFDEKPLIAKNRVAPAGQADYSYKKPFVDYNKTLRAFADWQVYQRQIGYHVSDTHAALGVALENIRKTKPDYTFSSDGIHPNSAGHLVMAISALEGWRMPTEVKTSPGVHLANTTKTLEGYHRLTIKTPLPWPIDPSIDSEIVSMIKPHRLNDFKLTLTGLHDIKYNLSIDGINLGNFTRDQLSKGVDLNQFPNLPVNKQAQEVLKLIKKRRSVVSPAWREHVGHKRPGNYPAQPIDKAMETWNEIENQINKLVQPMEMGVLLKPVD